MQKIMTTDDKLVWNEFTQITHQLHSSISWLKNAAKYQENDLQKHNEYLKEIDEAEKDFIKYNDYIRNIETKYE